MADDAESDGVTDSPKKGGCQHIKVTKVNAINFRPNFVYFYIKF